jgi:galactokinase
VTDLRVERLRDALGDPSDLQLMRAPGRVNLIGDHTDYCEGFVLPMAIDRDCLVASTSGSDTTISARSLEMPGTYAVPRGRSTVMSELGWAKFVAGAVAELAAIGADIPALDLAVSSTVPAGSGLSSSSALSVALTLALADAAGFELAPRDAARAALDGEIRATGVPGGLMDQLASLFGRAGHALLIDCRSLDIEPIPLPDSLTVVVVDSGLPRTLADSEYAQRRSACEAAAARLGIAALRDATLEQVEDDPIARHVVTENARVLAAADALRTGEVDALGPLLLQSHASLRDDYRVSTPELDLLVALFTEHGANGARLTGAGFGGCVVALSTPDTAESLMHEVKIRYESATGLAAAAFVVDAADGAGSA